MAVDAADASEAPPLVAAHNMMDLLLIGCPMVREMDERETEEGKKGGKGRRWEMTDSRCCDHWNLSLLTSCRCLGFVLVVVCVCVCVLRSVPLSAAWFTARISNLCLDLGEVDPCSLYVYNIF